MDSVTQFVLGAAVGEAVLRTPRSERTESRWGWGAAFLGGIVGTIPDLDVVTRAWLDGPERLAAHRGLSHSIFLCALLTPILASLFRRAFAHTEVSWSRWATFVWLVLNTHWMLDCFTLYGTQIFRPFSNYPVNGASVFIIDPVYTLTLLIGLVCSLWAGRGGRPLNPKGVRTGLALSTLYLLFTVASKIAVMHRFDLSWEASGRAAPVARITAPTPFNSILWYCYVDTGSDVWVADSSLFDPTERVIRWQRIPKNTELLSEFGEGRADKVLLWFSRGFYRLDIIDGRPVFIDLRFGRLKSWLVPQAPEGEDYMFCYNLQPANSKGPFDNFDTVRPSGRFSQFPWELFWARLRGQDPLGAASHSN